MAIWDWLLGMAAVAFFAFRAGRRRERSNPTSWLDKLDEGELGALGPVSAALLTGTMTRAEADAELEKWNFVYPNVSASWSRLSDGDRAELGRRMLILQADPAFMARQDRAVNKVTKFCAEAGIKLPQ